MLPLTHALQLVPALWGRDRQRNVVSTTLESLLPRAVAGEAAALEALLTKLVPRVRNLVRYLVWRDSDVDDLTQEALLVVLDGLASYRGEGSFEGWVDRVAVRAVFRNLKRLRKEPSRVQGTEPFDGAELVANNPHPDEYLSRRQAVAALDRLSPEQRHVLVLHHVLDLTVPEMAAQLKIPAETVRSRLRLARQNLRAHNLAPGEASRTEETP